MSITIGEHPDSRFTATGTNPRAEVRLTVVGTDKNSDTDAAARQAVRTWALANLNFDVYGDGSALLYQQDIDVRYIGDLAWEAIVAYGLNAFQTAYAFDTSGGTHHITQSKQTRGRYGARAIDHRGAIGVTGDNVEGVDIVVPAFNLQETHYLTDSQMTDAYARTIFQLTGTVNDAPFRIFNSGECLFLGATGQKRGLDLWEVTYKFAGSANRQGFAVGGISVGEAFGWDYIWCEYQKEDDQNAAGLANRVRGVYVERVYEPGNFNLLGI